MLKRILSAVLLIPLLLVIVYYKGIILYLSVMVVSVMGLNEFYKAMNYKNIKPISWVGYILTVLILSALYFSNSIDNYLSILVFTVLFLSIIQLPNRKYNILDASVTLYGVIYIGLMLGHIILISQQENGVAIWLIFIIAWATDTFAYFSGYFLGRNKLCPNISPKKTVEGAIGGILGSVICCGLFSYFLLKDYTIIILILGAVGSVISQIGDLTASIIKRYTGIKDYGNLIPGHGGILDRFDSILFTAPTVYYFLVFFINN